MKKNDDPFEGVFDCLQDMTVPSNEQKEKILTYVLMENRLQNNSAVAKLGIWISVYPWRFAFSAAATQGVVFTLIFGTGYTNLFLRLFGG